MLVLSISMWSGPFAPKYGTAVGKAVVKSGTPSVALLALASFPQSQSSDAAPSRTEFSLWRAPESRHHWRSAISPSCRMVRHPSSSRDRHNCSGNCDASKLHCRQHSSWSCSPRCRFAHSDQIPHWFHAKDPSPALYNKARSMPQAVSFGHRRKRFHHLTLRQWPQDGAFEETRYRQRILDTALPINGCWQFPNRFCS